LRVIAWSPPSRAVASGCIGLRARSLDPPTFGRHDHENGLRYADPVDAEFTIDVLTGQMKV
jgi:hypothetical protein